jgi:hypothetical protein
MPRHSVCLISAHDADLLLRGHELNCRDHKHIDRVRAQLLASGTQLRPNLDPDFNPHQKHNLITEPYKPSASWARVPCDDCKGFGCKSCAAVGTVFSDRYLAIFAARNWQVIGGSQQYALLGSAKQQRKRTKTHLRHSRGKRRAGNGPVRQMCRPLMLRAQTA